MFEGLALSRAYDSVLDIQFDTGREILTGRVNVYQFGCEISVRAFDEAHNFTVNGPVTSTSLSNGSV